MVQTHLNLVAYDPASGDVRQAAQVDHHLMHLMRERMEARGLAVLFVVEPVFDPTGCRVIDGALVRP
jgi:hypothetical protein